MNKEKVILVVDDELIILESLKIQLSRFITDDIIIEFATSGEEAFDIINEYHENDHPIHLLVSDFNLEDMKGTDIVKFLHIKFPSSRKVILTGQADSEIIQKQANEIIIDDFIPKPWNFDHMKNTILSMLNN